MSNELRLRVRLLIESLASVLAGIAALVTLAEPAWIETITGADPDRGSGSLELGIVVGLVAVAIAAGLLARLDWRQVKAATIGDS